MNTNNSLNLLDKTKIKFLSDLEVRIVTQSDFDSLFPDSSLEKIDLISYSVGDSSFCFSNGLFKSYISILDFSRLFIANSISITQVSLFHLGNTIKSPLIFYYEGLYFIVDNFAYRTLYTDFFKVSFLSDNCFVVA